MKKLASEQAISTANQLRMLKLLIEIERWDELGIDEYLPKVARKRWSKTIDKTTKLLDRILGPRPKKGQKP
jgi:hypothetical protein